MTTTATTSASTSARRRRVLLVPPLAAAAAGLLAARLAFDSDTHQDCRCPGPSPRMYVTSWAGVMCAVGCLLVFAAVRRGGAGAAVWPRRLAAGSACVALAVLLALLATVYWLYALDPSGGQGCSGLDLLVRSLAM
ncbi:hypothetical protein ACFV6E_36935 [Streptomyces sp. NPDC059785]|uniref:hypothetical protein n=1 Tax=Streptomyces sp. NPDC059785 TaxID=3346945 RepID=UPI0036695AAB